MKAPRCRWNVAYIRIAFRPTASGKISLQTMVILFVHAVELVVFQELDSCYRRHMHLNTLCSRRSAFLDQTRVTRPAYRHRTKCFSSCFRAFMHLRFHNPRHLFLVLRHQWTQRRVNRIGHQNVAETILTEILSPEDSGYDRYAIVQVSSVVEYFVEGLSVQHHRIV
jgi:hypothetical protein